MMQSLQEESCILTQELEHIKHQMQQLAQQIKQLYVVCEHIIQEMLPHNCAHSTTTEFSLQEEPPDDDTQVPKKAHSEK
jgi:hypothetical protein